MPSLSLGYKNAALVRFDYRGVSFAFVGAHLHAHDENLQIRVNNYNKIVQQKFKFDSDEFTIFSH